MLILVIRGEHELKADTGSGYFKKENLWTKFDITTMVRNVRVE